MMATCCKDQTTEYCPHCGARLKRDAGETLLAYLKTQVRRSEKVIELANQMSPDSVHRWITSARSRAAVKQLDKWKRWVGFVERAMGVKNAREPE